MPIKQFKPMSRRHAVPRHHRSYRGDPQGPREVAARAAPKKRRPQPPRPHHLAPSRRRSQAEVPDHRLQAQQARRGRPRDRDRVRSEPQRQHRADRVRGRREALHPAPDRAEGGRRRWCRGRARTSGSATRSRSPRSRWVPRCTTSSCARARAGRWRARPAPAVQVVAKEGDYVTLRMPSTEMRMVRRECMATIGQIGNVDHSKQSIGKAGANRWRGRRPKVRGVAMNPVDHPHGRR